ncbi:SpoIIE family protein phosphatase [Nocardiopsis metallicus]|uniref:protein-serine/threonine phosphatase n=1 Tax=Nocardiopsis metallicus TaxID=179819 RepID=A0A840W949_9ACTN|nr:SpoIIE family protein phosphatase [Nocardiopsis metallicus]MBB5489581.1 PAS domain S-box-containing protein [Nocardiopsis metallicus]
MSDIGRPWETDMLRAVFDSVGAGMLVLDSSGLITASNPYARQIVDRPGEQLLGADMHDLLHRDEDGNEIARRECPIMGVLDSGEHSEGSEEFYLRGDGTLVPIIWAASPLQHGGAFEGAVVVFHDFKKHRDANEQTAAHLAALEELTTRLSMVAEVSTLLISSLHIGETLDGLVRLLVPELGDWAVVDLLPEDGTEGDLKRVAVHSRGDRGGAESLKGPLPPLPHASRAALARALYNNEPVLLDASAQDGEPDEPIARAHRQLFEHLGEGSAMVVPLYTRRQVFGALTVARRGQQTSYTDAEIMVLTDIARRAGLVIESTRLFEQRLDMAETLQRQLLTPLPQVDHLWFAARYQPAQQASEVGGDWYDAFLLADGVTTMVIGDVVGHDLQAAAHMAEVRNMLRALAWDRQEPPSEIMRRLDGVMTHTSDAPMATVVFARIEGPDGGPWHLHWVNAGHPPPLLVTAGGEARYLEDGHGPLLGMNSALHLGLEWPDAREELPERSTLLFYTDGLVESRDRHLDTGLEELRRHAADLVEHELEDFLDGLLARIDPKGDDVALLALRIPPAGAGADEDPAAPQRAHSPAVPERGAPGSRVEGSPVRDTSDPV